MAHEDVSTQDQHALCVEDLLYFAKRAREREREREKKIEREQASPVSFFCSPFSPTKSFDWLGYETMFWDHQSTKRCSRA